MTISSVSTSLFQFDKTLTLIGREYVNANAQALLAIERRLERFSNQASQSLHQAAGQIEPLKCAMAVNSALDESNRVMVEMMRNQLAGMDFSRIWGVLWDVTKEVALYIGGGAIIGGAVGGGLGALAGGVGAIPGAAMGAVAGIQIANAVLAVIGLVELGKALVHVIPTMCKKMAEGFAKAWRAGQLPDGARGQRSILMREAAQAFAEGKMMLLVSILSAISLILAKKDLQRIVMLKNLGNSKLGNGFANWVKSNEDKLIEHPGLKRKSAAAQGDAAKAPAPGKAPAPDKPATPAAKDKDKKEGEANESCPTCLLIANPINPITGSKILAGEIDLDFALPAPLPLVWQRTYSSAQRQAGWMGPGWTTPLSLALQVSVDSVVVLDAFAREITFSMPQVGESLYSPSEKMTLARTGERSFELIDDAASRNLFALSATASDIAHLVGTADANGNSIAIHYNQRQLPERIEDSAGRIYMLEFKDHRGHPRLRTISVQRDVQHVEAEVLVQYQYDEGGTLSHVRNGAGDVTRQFVYRNYVMVEHSQPGGLVSRYEYDEYAATGKVTRNWTNSGLSWNLRYLPQETIVADNLGREQRYRFDHKRRFIGQVDAAGGVSTRTLDSDGNILSVTDAGGRSSIYRYDGRGRVIRVESGGSGTGIVYDSRFDKPALITDAQGATTALRYDEFGNLTSVTDALGQRTSYQYDAHGLPVRMTDAAGGVKRLAYNRAAQLISYTDCSNNNTYFGYDDNGQLVRATDALGNSTSYNYDPLGRLLAMVQPDGATERYEYDPLGRLLASIDPAGNRTSYVLDSDGHPLKRVDARGGVLEYRYDDARRIAQLINENGDVHSFVYDALDRLSEETGFDARLTRYRYDDSGLVAAKEEHGSGERNDFTRIDTHYLRDTTGQLIEKIISRSAGDAQAEQLRLRYAYDSVGRMTRASNADAEVTLDYDALGQLTGERTETRTETTELQHAYDELGNRIKTTLPDGRVLNNLFYGSGHLHQINIDGDVITDIERDKLHRMTSRTQGALTSQFQYDPMGRLLSQVAGHLRVGEGSETVIARRYEYDETGNLLAIDDKRNGSKTYSYDVIGRIMSAVQPNLTERFAFDPAHNLLDTTVASAGRVESNRVRVFEDKRYDYDAHGNLTEKLTGRHTRMRLEWNAAHQLVKSVVTRNAQDATPTVQTVKYAYDPFGRRIAKRDAFGTTRFVWDGNRLLCEARGQWARTYVYEPGSFVPLARVETVATQSASPASASTMHHIHTDHLGTPNEVTDQQGDVTWAVAYKAWGNVLAVIDIAPERDYSPIVDADAAHSAAGQAQPIRFQGQYHDSETGLFYNRFRYYDADCGRFVSIDPIGLAGGNNLYQYADNPIAWIDPLGLAGFLFRGDTSYSGGPIGKPQAGQLTAKDILRHVTANGDGTLTSFSEKLKGGNGSGGATDFSKTNVVKVSSVDIAALEANGTIRTLTPEQAKAIMKSDPKLSSKANDVFQIMKKNNEVLVHGQIPNENIVKCKC